MENSQLSSCIDPALDSFHALSITKLTTPNFIWYLTSLCLTLLIVRGWHDEGGAADFSKLPTLTTCNIKDALHCHNRRAWCACENAFINVSSQWHRFR